MAETDHRVTASDPIDLRDEARPMPATPPVIEVRPAETPEEAPELQADIPLIESSLVGEGGLPAASRAEAAAPQQDDAQPEASRVTEAPAAADAPDPGPIRGDSGPPPVLASPPPQRRRGGFWLLVLGGAVAAGLGSAATIWALPNLPGGLRPAPSAPAMDEAALQSDIAAAARAEVAAQADALVARAREAGAEAARETLAEAPAAAPPEDAALRELQARVAALEDLGTRVEALETRPAPEEAAAAPAQGDAAPAEVAALRQELAAQAQRIEQFAARPQPDPDALQQVQDLAASADAARQRIEAAATEAEQRLATAEDKATEIERKVAEAARRSEALAAVGALQAALLTGGDRGPATEALAAAGVEAPQALAVPAPSLEELQEGFPEAARAGLRASLRDDAAARGSGNALTNFLRAQTGARSLEPRSGGDPDAVLSRAGDAVQRGDIAAALKELAGLPPAGREAMAEWMRGAEAWTAAAEALGQVEGNLK